MSTAFPRRTHRTPSAVQRTARIATTILVVLGSGCRTTTPETALPPVRVVELDSATVAAMDPTLEFAHTPGTSIMTICTALAWSTCRIPEVTDDQAFMDAKDTYGPHAFVAPSEHLGTWNQDTDFASGQLVGFVHVASGTLPSTYTDLNLTNGFTCFYLKFTTSFVAHTFNTTGVCPTTIPSGAVTLSVFPISPPSPFTGSDIPAVARFHEVQKGPSRGNPAIGFRCGSKWCVVLPKTNTGETAATIIPLLHAPDKPNNKTWVVYGWSDVQTVALPPLTSPGDMVRSTMEVSVVADARLQRYNATGWPSGFVRVATIRHFKSPYGKYQNEWRLKRGFNDIYMKKLPNGEFAAQLWHIVQVGGIDIPVFVRYLTVNRVDHGRPIPATVRFLWSAGDEDVWVACDDGCCKISTGN